MLIVGGAFLCYEGFEKVAERLFHRQEAAARHAQRLAAVADESVDLAALERDRIKGAIRTDFILSAEIIVIALGTVSHRPFGTQLSVLAAIGVLMTVGVYRLVAGIVKLDDLGLRLARSPGGLSPVFGRGILAAAPSDGRGPAGHRYSSTRKLRSCSLRLGCLSLRSALASICRMRSRVTSNCLPTSSSV